MAEESARSSEDPLIAALPPATDYITYLTLLEYQLKPGNLQTLNRLLSEDSGTLAEEIGWDLLRLVLPMLNEVPQAANSCLDIIARRGNPREVVVRLAEELEKLGHQPLEKDDDEASIKKDEGESDGLPTFPGEAKRVHLGEMKLDGMPETETIEHTSTDAEEPASIEQAPVDTAQQDQLVFKALVSMLCVVHPRIKTQYPSRFLATSLPAALGAYRRMDTSLAATESFFLCLSKLGGKQIPPLPPRASTGSVPAASDGASTSGLPASLPDPEAPAEADIGTNIASANEEAIIGRLLQAVLLEVVDEYMSSLQIHETPTMSWTSRLRERREPRRVVPGKQTEGEVWQKEEELRQRDELVSAALSLAKELRLDVLVEFEKAFSPSTEPERPEDEDEEPYEYPASPAHIPFTPTALLLLRAAQQFVSAPEASDPSFALISKALQTLTSLSGDTPYPAVQDSLHVLLYSTLMSPSQTKIESPSLLINVISTLTRAFTTVDPQLRDDAHHIATKLLHEQCDSETRIIIIKQTLRGSIQTSEPPNVIQLAGPGTQAIVRAAGVDWLKEELCRAIKPSTPSDVSHPSDSNPGINISTLDKENELSTLIFPPMPSAPEITPPHKDRISNFLVFTPFYISVLNLCCVVLSTAPSAETASLRTNATNMHSSLGPWLKYLLNDAWPEILSGSLSEVWACEDAFGRLKVILEKDV